MELLKDYDFNLLYHPGKANVVADTLRRRPQGIIATLLIKEWQALETLIEFDIQAARTEEGRPFECLRVQLMLVFGYQQEACINLLGDLFLDLNGPIRADPSELLLDRSGLGVKRDPVLYNLRID